jgi:hypothetical protein
VLSKHAVIKLYLHVAFPCMGTKRLFSHEGKNIRLSQGCTNFPKNVGTTSKVEAPGW